MVEVSQLIPIHAESTVVNHYNHQKSELHFDRKSDSDFIMFLLDTAVRVISVAKYLVPVVEAVSEPVIGSALEEEENDKNLVLSSSQSELLDSLGLSRSDIHPEVLDSLGLSRSNIHSEVLDSLGLSGSDLQSEVLDSLGLSGSDIQSEVEVVGTTVEHPETMSESSRTQYLSETELEHQTNLVTEGISQLQDNVEALEKEQHSDSVALEDLVVKLEPKLSLIELEKPDDKTEPGMTLEEPVVKVEPWIDDNTSVDVCSDVENEPNITSRTILQTVTPDTNDVIMRSSLDSITTDQETESNVNKTKHTRTPHSIGILTNFISHNFQDHRKVTDIEPELLNEYLCHFYKGVTKKDGSKYSASRLIAISDGIHRYFKQEKYIVNIRESDLFIKSRYTRKTVHSKLRNKKVAASLTVDEIDILFEKKVAGLHSPKALQNFMCLLCLYFGYEGKTQLQSVQLGDIVIRTNEAMQLKYVTINEQRFSGARPPPKIAREQQGNLNFVQMSDITKCPVAALEKYHAMRSDKNPNSPFLINVYNPKYNEDPRPAVSETCVWFGWECAGAMSCSKLVARMVRQAGINLDGRVVDNSSIRKFMKLNIQPLIASSQKIVPNRSSTDVPTRSLSLPLISRNQPVVNVLHPIAITPQRLFTLM